MQPQDVADLVSNEVNHTIWTFLQISSYRLQLFCPYCLMDFHVHIIQNGEILAKPLQTPAHKITQWPQTHFLPLAFVLFITHQPSMPLIAPDSFLSCRRSFSSKALQFLTSQSLWFLNLITRQRQNDKFNSPPLWLGNTPNPHGTNFLFLIVKIHQN